MLRIPLPETLPWSERTKSVSQLYQLEQCEKRLGRYIPQDVLVMQDDTLAEQAYAQSWYAEEKSKKEPKLHTIKQIKRKIKLRLPL